MAKYDPVHVEGQARVQACPCTCIGTHIYNICELDHIYVICELMEIYIYESIRVTIYIYAIITVTIY